MDLLNTLEEKIEYLEKNIKTLRKTGEEYAKAYTDYRIALAEELLKLKNEGMAVTIAYDIARGKKDIAKLKYDEICKEAIYKANQEAINSIKLQLRIIENQIGREYNQKDIL